MIKSIKCRVSKCGKRTKIDVNFYSIYKKYKWWLNSNGYVITKFQENKKQHCIYLAHMVMNFNYDKDQDLMVDHKYHDKLDNRKKKLRIVSRSINCKNLEKTKNNTGVIGIHLDEKNNRYVVNYTINYISQKEFFSFSNLNQKEAFQKANNFINYIKSTDPEYIIALCFNENESSSGISINESEYEGRIDNGLFKNNTSGYNNIYDNHQQNRWVVIFYNENGEIDHKGFSYGIKSKWNKEESLIESLNFQKSMEKYHPKMKKRHNYEENDQNSNEEFSIESYDDKKFKQGNETDSGTISMDEEEIQKEIENSINQEPLISIHDGIYLDLEKNRYIVSYIENGFTEQESFYFGSDHKYEWWAAKGNAENFKYLKDKLL